MRLNITEFWPKLVDYYYDNVHWDEQTGNYEPLKSINIWLNNEYGATVSHTTNSIYFNNDEKMGWFLLRWS